MPHIRTADKGLIDKLFAMDSGYVLDFSDRTVAEFFTEDLNMDIYDPIYSREGTSRAKRLRCFLKVVDAASAVRVLTWIAQMATIVTATVLGSPHSKAPATRGNHMESQPIHRTQDVFGWTLRD
jgi:hypothetical protein